MNKKLKPCPYCGGEGHIRVLKDLDGNPKYYIPTCKKDYCPGQSEKAYESEMFAAIFWNIRTPDIIKCKECKHYEENDFICNVNNGLVCPDWFCHYGKTNSEGVNK